MLYQGDVCICKYTCYFCTMTDMKQDYKRKRNEAKNIKLGRMMTFHEGLQYVKSYNLLNT